MKQKNGKRLCASRLYFANSQPLIERSLVGWNRMLGCCSSLGRGLLAGAGADR